LTFRDANEDNNEAIATYKAMNLAVGMDDFQKAQADHNGIPFINTIAASRDGRAWYADTSAAPHLSREAIAAWQERLKTDPATRGAYAQRMILLDGSNSLFEWVDDARARDPGVVPVAEAPQLERRDYVFNANDSYWMSHAEELLTGFSPVHGGEGTARSLRTRMNATTLSRVDPAGPAGEDGKFSLEELAAAALSNRGYAAMLLRDELVERCTGKSRIRLAGETVDIGEACQVLSDWDGLLNLESVGAVLWREFITRYSPSELRRAGELFAEKFDRADPLHTPRGLAPGDLALQKLAQAVQLLNRAGIALDTPLGELQYNNKNSGRIPIHGGLGGYEGVENNVGYAPNGTTLEPDVPIAPRIEGSRYLTLEGYPINRGTSFIMAMEFAPEGPRAWAFMTYGQSGDPDSPYFTDQTELFSKKEWRRILFTPDQIEEDPGLSVLSVRGAR
jgi:acyl-homoserine-lactone acylase